MTKYLNVNILSIISQENIIFILFTLDLWHWRKIRKPIKFINWFYSFNALTEINSMQMEFENKDVYNCQLDTVHLTIQIEFIP